MTATVSAERWVWTVSAGRSERVIPGDFPTFRDAVAALLTVSRKRWAERLECYCGSAKAEWCACAGTGAYRTFVETLETDAHDYRSMRSTDSLYPESTRYVLPYNIGSARQGWLTVQWNLYRAD